MLRARDPHRGRGLCKLKLRSVCTPIPGLGSTAVPEGSLIHATPFAILAAVTAALNRMVVLHLLFRVIVAEQPETAAYTAATTNIN